MGRSVEKSGKTVNEAIAAALAELDLSIEHVHVDVLNEGKAGLFGILSGKTAKVRVSELDEDERVPQPGYTGVTAAGADDHSGEDELSADGAADTDAEQEGGGPDAGAAYSGAEYDGEYSGEQPYDLDYEINRAIEYLEEIFKGINVSADLSAEPTDEGFIINIESDDSGILIGHRGETLDAFQYLVNLYMNKGRSKFIRVNVDIENYKKKRESALIRMAGQTADKVVRLRRNFTLDAMNSYERRIVHSALQNHPKVETYSVGEDPNRKVVVTLKNRGGYQQR